MNLKLSIFSNAGTVPLEIAIQRGFFEEAGLTVDIVGTTSSIDQMTGVIDRRFDIAATAIDNVIAYNCGQGAASTRNASKLKVFLGSASYRLPLVVNQAINSFDDLKGCTIAVDALNTGFAFLLREMLEINGLGSDEYVFKSFGAPKERWQALVDGKAVGALLNAHFENIAHHAGCTTLNSSPNPWDNYEGNTFCAGPEFLNDGPVEAFTEAVLQAVAFTKDPKNTHTVATALTKHLGILDSDSATKVALSLQGTHSILVDDLPVSRSGVIEVLRLREKYTSTTLGLMPEDLCDSRITFSA
jgi:ABC-type nitrate/sulfonate/bicarbonate transport system substrate-binding protein